MLLLVSAAQAQYIAFKDTVFRDVVAIKFPSIYRADTLGGVLDTTLARTIPNGSFSAIGKNISNVDEIRHFIKLDTINFSKNNISSIESFKGLRSVDYFNLSENPLQDLSNIDRLVALKHLVARNCQLSTVPSNMNLMKDSLNRINVSFNNIQSIQADFSLFQWEWYIIHDNYLSFEDILPLTAANKFNPPDIFPQKPLPLQVANISIREGSTLTIDAEYDKNLSGITYYLFKEGVLVDSSTTGTFSYEARQSMSGNYYVEIKSDNPLTAGYSVRTESINVFVGPCVDANQVYFSILDSTDCNFKVVVNGLSEPGLAYILNGLETDTIDNGVEVILSRDQLIEIKPIVKGVCANAEENTFNATIPACDTFIDYEENDAVLTPNDDGIQDYYKFTESGNVKVYGSNGVLVNEFATPFTWRATDKHGNLLPPDYYLILINDSKKEYITIQY